MRIESPVKRFPGYVILPEYLTVPQVRAITTALGDPIKTDEGDKYQALTFAVKTDEIRLPAVIACISEWHLAGIPEHPALDNFPMSPMSSVHKLLDVLLAEIIKLWQGEDDLPNV